MVRETFIKSQKLLSKVVNGKEMLRRGNLGNSVEECVKIYLYKLFDANVMECNKVNNKVKPDYFNSRKNFERSF